MSKSILIIDTSKKTKEGLNSCPLFQTCHCALIDVGSDAFKQAMKELGYYVYKKPERIKVKNCCGKRPERRMFLPSLDSRIIDNLYYGMTFRCKKCGRSVSVEGRTRQETIDKAKKEWNESFKDESTM